MHWENFKNIAAAEIKHADLLYNHIEGLEHCEIFVNNIYHVFVRRYVCGFIDSNVESPPMPPMFWLAMRRNDEQPMVSRKDKQRIKNEIIGPSYEGYEIYPREERVMNTNYYHMFVAENPDVYFPLYAIKSKDSQYLVTSDFEINVQVVKFRHYPEVLRIDCLRHDGKDYHDWSALQSIKNQLAGPKKEGFEVYPSQKKFKPQPYTLFVLTREDGVFPYGFTNAVEILLTPEEDKSPGTKNIIPASP